MAQQFQPKTIKELLNWSYANLAALRVALSQDPPAYTRVCWMTRARVYKGLQTGNMKRSSIYKNEREKLSRRNECAYCGAVDVPLTLDHLFARSRKGSDSGDNLIYCCHICNSSKNNRDYFEWIKSTGRPVNIAIAERYLKNAYTLCEQHGILDMCVDDAPADLPFDLQAIPLNYDILWLDHKDH